MTWKVSWLSLTLIVSLGGVYFYSVQLGKLPLGNASSLKFERQRHDKSSTFTVMRTEGLPFDEERDTHRSGLVLDALTIGTQNNLELLEAQQQTWASSKSIRHFFAATELDDADATCYTTLNKRTIWSIIDLCRTEQPYAKPKSLISQYKGFGQYLITLEEFLNTTEGQAHNRGGNYSHNAGWMCAIQRMSVAMERLGRFYRREQEVDSMALPDFLMIQDDDTYYNMIKIQEFLKHKDPSIPRAEAPCLIQHHSLKSNFSFPWGGYGFFLSKGAIANLIRPIYCTSAGTMDEFRRNVCARLEEDLIGERHFFINGMSISDLMGAHVRNNLFTQFSRTNWSYCLQADWAFGYYINFYYISNQIEEPGFENMTEFRIEGTLGGVFKPDKGNCWYSRLERCSEKAHVCHRQNAESMANHTKALAANHPGVFRNYN